MNYHLNFHFVWRYFDRLEWGLLLSLELAVLGVLAGTVIGLGLALLASASGRIVRTLIAAYVEFIRNVPLLLLVYLVFYGIPSVGGFAYNATTSFVITLAVYAGAYLVEVFRAGLQSVPRGLIDAGRAIGLTPAQRVVWVVLPTMFRIVLPSLGNAFIQPVQGHVAGFRHRGAGARVRRQLDLHQHLPHRRSVCGGDPDVPGHRMAAAARAARAGAAVRGAAPMSVMLASLPFLWRGLLVTLEVSAIVVVVALLAGVLLGLGLTFGPRIVAWPIRLYSDVMRGTPLLVLIFFIYYALPITGLKIGNFWAALRGIGGV